MRYLCWSTGILVCLSAASVLAAPPDEAAGVNAEASHEAGEELHILHHGGNVTRDYLLREMLVQYEARRQRVTALTSVDALREYQRQLRDRYRQLIGPLPEETPLHSIVTGTVQCDGYRIEKVAFQSRPGLHVTANLYVPTNQEPPFPGVLVPCGHSSAGKAYEAYQSVAILLAKHGLLTLVYDPLGQGKRLQLDLRGVSAGERHKLLNVNSIPIGRHFVHYSAWDGVRAIDYLETRAEFDRDEVGRSYRQFGRRRADDVFDGLG